MHTELPNATRKKPNCLQSAGDKNALYINFDAVSQMVTGTENQKITVKDEHKIVRDKKHCRVVTE